MDVTPRELRDIDIREGFRGYNRDDVDELLERAAATIESLNERIRRLTEQVSSVEGQQGTSRETEDMLHRTLLLAQRAADEAVAEAQFKARQILDEAESKSRAQLAEAESTARRQVETERRRLENEVMDLGSRRDALVADVDGLERFESEYRARLRRALETDLESLAGQGPVAQSVRPPLHEVDLPSASAPAPSDVAPAAPAPSTSMSPSTDAPGRAESPSLPAPPRVAPPVVPTQAPQTPQRPSTEGGSPTAEIRGLGTWEPPSRAPDAPSVSEPAAAAPPTPSTPPAPPTPTARPPLFPPEQAETENLDDEAFFASLREAVSDQSPLGPRDEIPDETGTYEEEDDEEARSGLFRRRR